MAEGAPALLAWPRGGLLSPGPRRLAGAFARFLMVGGLGLAIDLGLFTVLDARALAPETARLVSLGCAFVVTFALNRRFTFARSGRNPLNELLFYGLGTLAAQSLSYGVFLLLVYRAPALPRSLSLLAGAGLAAFVGFASHRHFAFAAVGTARER